MKRLRILTMISILILSSLACSFSDRLRNLRVIDLLIGDKSSNVDSVPQDVVEEFTDDPVRFSCRPESLEPNMGDNWKLGPIDLTDLILDVSARGDILEYSISFSSDSDLVVETDPDYRPPPGATQVPDGVYVIVEKYWGAGTAQLDKTIFSGNIKIDYEITTQFPDPVITTGAMELPVLGSVNLGDLEICFNVLPDQIDATAKSPGQLLRPNCRWPGYVFVCTPFE